ncbi:hypothetical protein EDI_271840 [Entamoeba dispar SAW760]|uniref:FHA domain-containing protein n=1 Tax=Entamoeba dispar (strain ATCC PRA-260 / SAW760) TaxID=370354 RepID=B0EFN7_ENTDS|nr:uncharacterized protein EDI_271840 [Entamoeba dispar SAW760]EDR26668.1 hypothetical protein EDI_271840 [Entamoeba dispar SAW760]|eukprot:EDR26668.1 hypothetical protein EDI_271840 [Entamoeba dispar SAW760]
MQNFYLISSSKNIFDLNKVLISIGSLGDIRIEEETPNILPRHCSLIVCDKDWGRCVCNLSDLAPVLVNGVKVETKQNLHHGDVLSVCGKEFTYLKKKEEKRPNTRITIKMNDRPSLKFQIKRKEETKPIPPSSDDNSLIKKVLCQKKKKSFNKQQHNEKCRTSKLEEITSESVDDKSNEQVVFNNIDYNDEVFIFDDDDDDNVGKTQSCNTSGLANDQTLFFANSDNISDDEPFYFD